MKSLAFCIPVMGRSDDVKATLANNLNIIEKSDYDIKLYINCFDEDESLSSWVISNFKKYIDSGVLVFNKLPTLRHWHFSWAKNSFQNIINEDYYSSLDGDNFLSNEEVESIFKIIDGENNAIVHGFSGQWGDGSSGRLTVPTELYKKYGYMNDIFPRQVDELGLIVNIIKNTLNINFYCYEGANIFDKSQEVSDWMRLNKFNLSIKTIAKKHDGLKPVNPRGENYVKSNEIYGFFQRFNAAYTFLKLSNEREAIDFFSHKLKYGVTHLTSDVAKSIIDKAFIFDKFPVLNDDITVYAVIKDDVIFLKKWVEHYRELGVKRFIIVDNDSIADLSGEIDGNDIFFFKPLVGNFKVCKVLWISMLLKCFQQPSSWFLTVDSDEFVSLEGYADSFQSYCKQLDKDNQPFASGILLDMLPNQNLEKNNISDFVNSFNHFYLRNDTTNNEYYRNYSSIKWAFADDWKYSYRIDSRWRFFQTFDCLRKYPLVKYKYDIELHQGFHALIIDKKLVSVNWTFKKSNYILPVKHYKMVKFFLGHLQAQNFDGYFDRTKDNLSRIVNKDVDILKLELLKNPFIKKYCSNLFRSVFKENLV